jgi:hypothetical protein
VTQSEITAQITSAIEPELYAAVHTRSQRQWSGGVSTPRYSQS